MVLKLKILCLHRQNIFKKAASSPEANFIIPPCPGCWPRPPSGIFWAPRTCTRFSATGTASLAQCRCVQCYSGDTFYGETSCQVATLQLLAGILRYCKFLLCADCAGRGYSFLGHQGGEGGNVSSIENFFIVTLMGRAKWGGGTFW